jgi:hypothetical protein
LKSVEKIAEQLDLDPMVLLTSGSQS